MPKVQTATSDDLAEAKAELKGDIANLKQLLGKSIGESEAKLGGQLGETNDRCQQLGHQILEASDRISDDMKLYFNSNCGDATKAEIGKEIGLSDGRMKATEDSLCDKIAALNAELRAAMAEEIGNLCTHFDKEIARTVADLTAADEQWAREAAEHLLNTKQELMTTIKMEKDKSDQQDEALRQAAATETDRVNAALAEQMKTSENLRDNLKKAEDDLNDKIKKLSEMVDENRVAAVTMGQNVHQSCSNSLTALRTETEKVTHTIQAEAVVLRDAVNEVENLNTRRIDWTLKSASQTLLAPTDGRKTASWFSPKFNAGGAHGLQLELQVFRKSDQEADALGDCAVFLWACKGTNIVFNLGVGKKMVQMEKLFNGTVPYGTRRLCFLKSQIDRDNDTLRVSLEVLESVRDIVHPLAIGPAPEGLEEEVAEDDPNGAPPKAKLKGSVTFKRHVNLRLMEQVKKQVEVMQSRMTRRVEWRLEQAQLLPKRFPMGEALCSPIFNAAGIDGFQLLFYPNGYKGSQDGYCSLFLSGVAGVTLKGALFLGKERRDISHTFEEAGAFGRTNYCKFEALVDDANAILVAFEVDEAMQEVQKSAAHALVQPGDRRHQAEIDGLPKNDSIVKMQRSAGSVAKGMEDKRVLPSLWTSKPQDKGGNPDRMHTFEELRRGLPPVDSDRPDPVSPDENHLASSHSLPFLKDRSVESVQASKMSRSTAGDSSCFSDNGGRKARGTSRRGPGPGQKSVARMQATT